MQRSYVLPGLVGLIIGILLGYGLAHFPPELSASLMLGSKKPGPADYAPGSSFMPFSSLIPPRTPSDSAEAPPSATLGLGLDRHGHDCSYALGLPENHPAVDECLPVDDATYGPRYASEEEAQRALTDLTFPLYRASSKTICMPRMDIEELSYLLPGYSCQRWYCTGKFWGQKKVLPPGGITRRVTDYSSGRGARPYDLTYYHGCL